MMQSTNVALRDNQQDWVEDLPRVSHRNDPATSKRAEKRVRPARITHAKRVLEAVRRAPGSTAPELMVATRLGECQVRRRLSDLKDLELVKRDYERDGNSCWWPT